jgi:hypothetical protein
MKSIQRKDAFGLVSDAEYVRENPRSPKMVQAKGATARGFMRGMGLLSVLPIAIDIARGPSPGASPGEAFGEGMCVFDVADVCGMTVPTGTA